MQVQLKQAILSEYQKLSPKIKSIVHFQNRNIRQKDVQGQLQRIFFAFAAYITAYASQYSHPFTIIITASHNPPNENGLKLEPLGEAKPVDAAQLEQILNNQQKFEDFVSTIEKRIKKQPENHITFFIGRDTRPTSEKLSNILENVIKMLGKNVVNLGQGSTPEIISMSQYLYQKYGNNALIDCQQGRKSYLAEIQKVWRGAVKSIEKQTGRSWEKKTVYLDFANGVGTVSAERYTFLNEFFDFKQKENIDFSLPNVGCGAQWLKKQKNNLPNLQDYPNADHYAWFDGDCDRILMRLKNEEGLVEGEDFIACITKFLKELLDALPHQLQLSCVSSIVVNYGLIKYLEKLNIPHQLAVTGMANLYKKAKNWDACTFFQPNGHGCVYFSQKALQFFQSCSQQWQAELLLLIHGLARNNGRGYAWHIFLLIQLYFFYYNCSQTKHFSKDYAMEIEYQVRNAELFRNAKEGARLLQYPEVLLNAVQEVASHFPEIGFRIRKASTSATVRLYLQGQKEMCLKAASIFDAKIKTLLQEIDV